MKARVHVMLKTGVLDPQGEAVRHALGALGFDGSFTDKGNDEALVSQVNAAFRLIRLRSLSKKS